MKKKQIMILLILGIIIGGFFYIINISTFEPHMTGGNGNPALLFMIPTVPLYVYFSILLYTTFSYFFSKNRKNKIVIYTLFSLFAFVCAMIGEYCYV